MAAAKMVMFAVISMALTSGSSEPLCDTELRERYCGGDAGGKFAETCRSCDIGPTCPVQELGPRSPVSLGGEILLQRRIDDDGDRRRTLMSLLDEKRVSHAFDTCVPLFRWDDGLAEIAQAWADQCALVEYNGSGKSPKRLHHDPKSDRARAIELASSGSGFVKEPGIAQSVHWARTPAGETGLTAQAMAALIESELQIEDGLIDGLYTNFGSLAETEGGNDVVAWGHATHVGCGWIQFPANATEDENGGALENFMVCNYAIGESDRSSCDVSGADGEDDPSRVAYYYATSQIIEDVKECLAAVRCRQKRINSLNFDDSEDEDIGAANNCDDKVQKCLTAHSGLEFIPLSRLNAVARSSGLAPPVETEAAKCKIDTILCGLRNSSDETESESKNGLYPRSACEKKLRRCMPLVREAQVLGGVGDDDDLDPGRLNLLPECRCADDLVLSDGSRGDCASNGGQHCLVVESPCVTLLGGALEKSVPVDDLNGLVHKSELLCKTELFDYVDVVA